jgi:hypothetical protein
MVPQLLVHPRLVALAIRSCKGWSDHKAAYSMGVFKFSFNLKSHRYIMPRVHSSFPKVNMRGPNIRLTLNFEPWQHDPSILAA